MQRAARERLRTLKLRKRWQALALARTRGLPAPLPPANRFRKQLRTGGCGHPRCWLCHGDKLAQRPAPRQQRALAAARDGLALLADASPA